MNDLVQFGVSWMVCAAAEIPIRPPAASSIADDVDKLHFFLTGLTLFFTALIFAIIFYFMVRYRRKSEDERPPDIEGSLPLELIWTLIPTVLAAVVFIWSSSLYVRNSRPPTASTEIFVVGKQWMWHIQHPEGQREINELHVPVDVPVELTMTSQDVIHDFYIPAFRVKKDVLPGRYTSLWFQATKTGTYHLFCGQYCGADHAQMIGWVFVMTPTDYAAWLSGGAKNETMAQAGERLFTQLGCVTCHVADGTGKGPSLVGIFGKPEKLLSGESRVVDETLIRQAIVVPNSVRLPKYEPIMPTFQGQINEEQVLQLSAYIKSLGSQEKGQAAAGGEAEKEPGAQAGEKLFNQLGCATCHLPSGTGNAPSLLGLYGKKEKLRTGETKVVDDAYVREAIVQPNSMPLPNYPPIMPNFQSQINDEQVGQLVAYVKSLGSQQKPALAAKEIPAQAGERLFTQLGCITCHAPGGAGKGPSLVGVYGKPQKLQSGETRVADETLLRQSIMQPNLVALPNYPPIMPSFQGQISDEQLSQLIAYMKSLAPPTKTTVIEKESASQAGEKLFTSLGCVACHQATATPTAPSLIGVYGKTETLSSGESKVVDDAFIRKAIEQPNSMPLINYPPIMPNFQGRISEEQMLQLIAYVKSLAPPPGAAAKETRARAGEKLFNELGCNACHQAVATPTAPTLVGIYGKTETLSSGESKVVDDAFIRRAIEQPNSMPLRNYPPIMPDFQGRITHEQLLQLIAYIKSLRSEERTPKAP